MLGRILGGRIFGRLAQRATESPILRDIAAAAVQRAADRITEQLGQPVPAEVRQQLEAEVAGDLAADPVLENNVSAEPVRKSRSFMAALAAFFGGFGVISTQVGQLLAKIAAGDLDGEFWLTAGAVLFGTGTSGAGLVGMIARLRDDLPPMRFRWWNPLSWLAGGSS